jgi:UDP-glucose 4-epimerase
VLALANVFGPRQDPHGEAGVVSIFLGAMLEGRDHVIFGDGKQTRDFVYVGDVADAFARAVDRGSAKVFNIGTSVETTVIELWESCARASSYSGEMRFAPKRLGELERIALDWSRARRTLGWKPTMGLDAGVAETASWIRSGIEPT